MHDPDSLNIAGTNIFDAENQQAERKHKAAIAARWHVKKVLIHLSDNPPLKDSYAYKDIKPNHEIRVLKLYAGAPGSKLVCCLIPSSFQSPGSSAGAVSHPHIPYDALSYYWGDAHEKPSHEIYVLNDDNAHSRWAKKGKNKNLPLMAGRMLIRTNLKDALEQLRSEQDHVYIWADAVCINQENIKEKTTQVARMHDVYTQAKKVHIWLGNPKDEIENKNVFNFLRTILDLKELDRVVERLEQKSESSSDKSDRQNCKSAIELMQAKWFSRRWVIQELALATNAHVRRGRQEMPWSDFADAIALFMTKYDQIKRLAFRRTIDYSASLVPGDHHINSLEAKALGAYALVTVTNDLFRKSSQGVILQRLLSLEVLVSSMLLAFEATDPKDTVFAVLQIAKDLQGSDQSHSKRSWGLILDLVPVILFMMWTVSNRVSNTNAVASELALVVAALSTQNVIIIFVAVCRFLLGLLITLLVLRIIRRALTQFFHSITADGNQPKMLDKRIEANYRKCLADVCADFIEYCIESSNSLDILCRHWAPVPSSLSQGMIVEMPSWILPITGNAFGGPSQSQRRRINGDSFVRGTERGSHYSASGSIPPSYKFGKTNAVHDVPEEEDKPSEDGFTKKQSPEQKKEYPRRFDGTLRVKGFRLGTIERTAPVAGGTITQAALELCGWKRGNKSTDSDQVWRILVANRGPDGINPPNWYRRACTACLEWYEKQLEDTFNTMTLKNMKGTPAGKVEFLGRVQQVVWNRNIISIAKQGSEVRMGTGTPQEYASTTLVGVAPQKSQKSDIVCILYGCSVPVVLQPIPYTKNYRFIGECYVHGAMDGEAVDPLSWGTSTKAEWFELH